MKFLFIVVLDQKFIDPFEDGLMESVRLLEDVLVSMIVIFEVKVLAFCHANVSEVGLALTALKV